MNRKFNHIIQAARSGGKVLLKYFGKNLRSKEKTTPSDFFTKADIESEKAILKNITRNFPAFNIFSEEEGYINKKSKCTFIIDPLDGSHNFILGIPLFSVNIALMEKDKAIFSVIYHPILNRIYYAEKNKGAFCGHKRLKVNNETNIQRSSISYTCGYTTSRKYCSNIIEKLNRKKVKRILSNWTPALDFCLLASGKIEAIINNNNDIYDYIAGKLIAHEAGALITDFKGKKEANDKNSIFIACNNKKIHQQLLKIL